MASHSKLHRHLKNTITTTIHAVNHYTKVQYGYLISSLNHYLGPWASAESESVVSLLVMHHGRVVEYGMGTSFHWQVAMDIDTPINNGSATTPLNLGKAVMRVRFEAFVCLHAFTTQLRVVPCCAGAQRGEERVRVYCCVKAAYKIRMDAEIVDVRTYIPRWLKGRLPIVRRPNSL